MANKGIIGKKTMRHPHGNPLQLILPLGEERVTVVDGNESRVRSQMRPNTSYPVMVELTAGVRRHRYQAMIENSAAIIEDNGTLPVGVYRIWVHYRDRAGRPMSYMKHTVLEVVEATEDGGTYNTDEFGVVATFPVAMNHSAGVVVTEDEVQLHEGIGFHGEVTEDEVRLYAEYGSSRINITEGEVQMIIINE